MTEFNGIRISAKDEIPKRVTIESFTARISGPYPIYWQDDYIIDYEINFTDPADEDNYYFLEFGEPYGLGGYLHEGEKVYDKEFVFQILASQIDESIPGWEPYSVKGLPFSDNGINGKNYTLHLSEIIQQAGKDYEKYIGLPREAKLYSISKDYYRFMISLIATDPEDDSIHGSLLGLGMVEPGRIYTNVAGGAGIVGSYIFDIATTNISKEVV